MNKHLLSVLSLVAALTPFGCIAEGSDDFMEENEENNEESVDFSSEELIGADVDDEDSASSESVSVSEASPADDGLVELENARLTQASALPGCPAKSLSWSQSQPSWNGNTSTAGNYICYGDVPAANSGYIFSAQLTSFDRTGSAQFTCTNGSWYLKSGTASCNGKIISTVSATGTLTTCSSADPVRSKWIGWYLADLKRCADTAGLDWWVGQYNTNAACVAANNYDGYGTKDNCWRVYFRDAANSYDNSYNVATALGHIAPSDEASICGSLAYPWASVSAFGKSCKYRP